MAQTIPTVVVVDDSQSVISLFEHCVEKMNVDLRTFQSVAEADEYLRDHRPDLLFLDIIMPGKDGLTYLRELREVPLHRDTSVIVISSKDYAQDRMVARDLGVVEFVAKPVRIQAIQDLIARHVN